MSENPLEIDPVKIKDIRVIATVMNGRVTYLPPELKNTGKRSQGITPRRDCVTGHLKYDQNVCVPEALHLRHPVNAYWAKI